MKNVNITTLNIALELNKLHFLLLGTLCDDDCQ